MSKPKKSFKNPAMQFISDPQEEDQEIQQQSGEAGPKPEAVTAPEGYKLNPMFVEVKNRRVQLVMQPSLYSKVKAKAHELDLSVNEYIHQTLEKAVKE